MSLTGEPHRALRTATIASFRPHAVNSYRDEFHTVVTRYVEAIAPRGRAEITSELLEPACERTVGDVMGFKDVDDSTLSHWFHGYAAQKVDFGRYPIAAERGCAVKQEVRDYLEGRIDNLVNRPDGTGLSHLVHDTTPNDVPRSVDDILGTVGVMIKGGFQEPAHGVANTLLGALGRPEQAARLREDPSRWSQFALEEGLRWLPPFGQTEKRTTGAVTLGGVQFAPETEVALVIASANRDPAAFADPDLYDLDRSATRTRHVAFGFGHHVCLGHYIARVLGRMLLEEIFTRLSGIRLDPDDEPFVHGWTERAARRLPVIWDA